MNVGQIGENIAAEFLIKKGWLIINKNYRMSFGEIDIVAKDCSKVLVFIEVKSLKGDSYYENNRINRYKPEDHLDYRKKKKLISLSSIYANNNPKLINADKGWRIDLVAVTIYDGHCEINHYENL